MNVSKKCKYKYEYEEEYEYGYNQACEQEYALKNQLFNLNEYGYECKRV